MSHSEDVIGMIGGRDVASGPSTGGPGNGRPSDGNGGTRRIRRAVVWGQRLLYVVAAVLLAYTTWVSVDAYLFNAYQSWRLDRMVAEGQTAERLPGELSAELSGEAASASTSAPAAERDLIGRIEIPRLDLSAVIVEGVGSRALRRAVGHIPGTPLPGEAGNVGLAAHRDTYFGVLRHVRAGDRVRIVTPGGVHEYAVELTMVVEPEDTFVLEPYRVPVLTLVTCYPFDYVGPAPRRFIVQAYRVDDGGSDAAP